MDDCLSGPPCCMLPVKQTNTTTSNCESSVNPSGCVCVCVIRDHAEDYAHVSKQKKKRIKNLKGRQTFPDAVYV